MTLETAINALRMKTAGPTAENSLKANMIAAELRNTLAAMTPKHRMDAIAKSLSGVKVRSAEMRL